MDVREAIIRTISYFDLFDRPLSRAEIVAWLYGGATPAGEVETAVTALLGEKLIKEEKGLIYFFDREGLSGIYAARKLFSARKWARARRWARIFAAFPGVELVGIGNTLAYDNARDGSDIDFFIVTAPGMIWRTRFFCAALAAIFDLRPKENDERDKLCLSFFVTDEALAMSQLSIGADDIYMHYWTRLMRPLYGNAGVDELFCAANPGAQPREKIRSTGMLRALFAPLALLPGRFMADWQQRHFPPVLRAAEARHDGSVVVSETVLKFHVSDRRREVYERWVKRVDSILHEARQNR